MHRILLSTAFVALTLVGGSRAFALDDVAQSLKLAQGSRVLFRFLNADDDTLVGPDDLGLAEPAFHRFAEPVGCFVTVTPAASPDSLDAVRAKIQGHSLSEAELTAIIDDITHYRYSDMEIETLRQMQNSLIALSVDAIGRKTRWERFKSIPPDERLGLVNSELIPDQNIQNLLQAYLVSDQKVSQLKGRLGEAHPDLVASIDSRAKIREQLLAQLRGYESALEIAWKESEARVEELRRQLETAKVGQILSARERMRPFEDAAQKLEEEQRLATTFRLTLRQREIDYSPPKRSIEILNLAEPARRPARPSWAINLTFAFLFGSLLAVGTAVFLEYLDTSFRSVTDIETRLRLPVLGVIPFQADPLGVTDADPAATEPYRVLHTNLDLVLKAGRPSALVLLSAGPAEGKSTTLHRLARLTALAGERTLLIDADLRRPAQHRLAARPRDPGLSDLLLGQRELEAVIQREIAPGLDFVPAGGAPDFTLGLLYAGRLRELIATLRGRYAKIYFDSPPIIGVSDASVLASAVDGVVLLIQHRRNPAAMVLRAQQIVTGLNTPLLGAVLTQVPPRSGEDYDYYTQNYAYYSDGTKSRHGTKSKDAATPAGGDKLVLGERPRRE